MEQSICAIQWRHCHNNQMESSKNTTKDKFKRSPYLNFKLNTVEIHSRSNHPIEFFIQYHHKSNIRYSMEIYLSLVVFHFLVKQIHQLETINKCSSGRFVITNGTFTIFPDLDSLLHPMPLGSYIRIGNIVHFYLTISATGTNNGDAIQILGLPYAAAGTDSGSASFAYNTGLVVNGATMPNIYITNTVILFYDTGSGNS